MLLGAAACLFLIACANTISLMIARSADHRRDMAIRGALGAGWVQMVRQHLIEGVLLGILGGVLGLLMAYWATEVMLAVSPTPIPRPDEVGINLRMIAFVFVIAIPAAIIPGVISSWRISRTPLNGIVNEGPARGGSLFSARLRRVLVISEVALTMAVLINAGLLFRSFRGLMQEKLGFDTYNVLTLELAPPATRYPDSPRRAALYQQIIDRVGSLPGVAHAGTVNYLPMFSGSLMIPVKLQEREVPPELWFSWTYRVASSDYFEAMKIPVIAGRTFSDRDGAAAPRVVILDQSAAAYLTKHFFPHESLLGKHVVLTFDKPTAFEIIGVAGDIRQQGLGISSYPGFYLHALQRPPAVAHLVVRTTIDPSSMSGLLRSTISAIDRDLPVSGLTLMEEHVTASVARRRFSLLLTTILGSGALLLSMLGLYSLMSHIVSGRTREIGVRMALGADAREVLRLILTQALGTVIAGTVLGILLALGTGGLIASMLVGVGTADPATFGLMTLMLVIVALVACYVPTRRAMRIAPAEALRHD
jgi:putative ABC transport system permease protein